MWTEENRPKYVRDLKGYPSDLTDAEWALVEPLIPPARHGGARRTVDLRKIAGAILHVPSTGCRWRAIPEDLGARSTACDYFDLRERDGTLDRIHETPYVACRERAEREASPTACIIDSQSVKSAEKGGPYRPRW